MGIIAVFSPKDAVPSRKNPMKELEALQHNIVIILFQLLLRLQSQPLQQFGIFIQAQINLKMFK